MRTTSAISFYCRESKKDRYGLSPVECSVTICGQRKFFNLPYVKLKASDFNKKRPDKSVVELCDLWRTRINSYMMDMLRQGMVVTAETLRETIQSGGVRAYTCERLFYDYLALLNKRVKINDLSPAVYRKYELVAERALKFIGKDKDVSTITPAVIKNIEIAWKSSLDAATLVGYLTKLKTFIKYGQDNGKITINPFQGIKITRVSKPIKALTEEEVNHLLTLNLEPRLQRCLDCLLIQIGTGMAYSDLMDFQLSDMKFFEGHWYISKPRNKTGKVFTALVLDFAVTIIQHYKVIPRLTNQYYNRALKLINPTYTSHLGRRTYASILANRNAPMEVVAAALGDDVKTAVSYYAKVLDSTIIKQQIEVFK